jgi:hypothetical protein
VGLVRGQLLLFRVTSGIAGRMVMSGRGPKPVSGESHRTKINGVAESGHEWRRCPGRKSRYQENLIVPEIKIKQTMGCGTSNDANYA